MADAVQELKQALKAPAQTEQPRTIEDYRLFVYNAMAFYEQWGLERAAAGKPVVDMVYDVQSGWAMLRLFDAMEANRADIAAVLKNGAKPNGG